MLVQETAYAEALGLEKLLSTEEQTCTGPLRWMWEERSGHRDTSSGIGPSLRARWRLCSLHLSAGRWTWGTANSYVSPCFRWSRTRDPGVRWACSGSSRLPARLSITPVSGKEAVLVSETKFMETRTFSQLPGYPCSPAFSKIWSRSHGIQKRNPAPINVSLIFPGTLMISRSLFLP